MSIGINARFMWIKQEVILNTFKVNSNQLFLGGHTARLAGS